MISSHEAQSTDVTQSGTAVPTSFYVEALVWFSVSLVRPFPAALIHRPLETYFLDTCNLPRLLPPASNGSLFTWKNFM